MDQNDILILRELRMDSRKTLVDINKTTKIPVSTIFDKLSKMEAKGLIRYAGLYNYEKLGHNLRVNFLVKSQNSISLQRFLDEHPKINNLYKINNGFDYYIEAIFRNFSELEEFNDGLSKLKVEKSLVFHTLEEIKKERHLI